MRDIAPLKRWVDSYEDRERIEMPENPFGFLERYFSDAARVPTRPLQKRKDLPMERILKELDPDMIYYVNPGHEPAKDIRGIPVRFVPPSDGGNYDVEESNRFRLIDGRVMIKWEDAMGRERFGGVDWKELMTEERAMAIKQRLDADARRTRERKMEERRRRTAERADKFARMAEEK